MNKNNKEILLSVYLNKKELTSLTSDKNIEELIVLLASIHVKNIKKYLLKNNNLLNYDIYDLAYIIGKVFNEKRNYCTVKRILLKNKYAIISEKGDVK